MRDVVPGSGVAHFAGLGAHLALFFGIKDTDRVIVPGVGDGELPASTVYKNDGINFFDADGNTLRYTDANGQLQDRRSPCSFLWY